MAERFCVIGLGNPGSKYKNTRHNIGFDWLESAAQQLRLKSDFSEKFNSLWLTDKVNDRELHFLKPQTFMNLSGEALQAWKNKFQGEAKVLVVYDDMDLPLGKIRYRGEGSDGGHRGLRSILEASQTDKVPRLRLGIGRPENESIEHVLDKFKPDEKIIVQKMLDSAGEQLKIWLEAKSEEDAMNKLNGAKFSYVS